MEPVMDILEITKKLPHRYPFLLIDRVVELSDMPEDGQRVGRKVKALKNVTMNEPFFQGHFPHRPVMPGVLLIEAMAQACAMACWNKDDPNFDVSIASLRETKFRRPVVPGDQLIISGEVLKDRKSMLLFAAKAEVDGQVVAETEILAYVVPLGTY